MLLNTLEKNISKVSIGKLNTGNLYIPIVITENEHTIRDILNEVYVSNSDRKYIPVAALTDLSMEYDYKKIFGKKEGVVVPVQVYNTGDSIREIIKTVRTEAVKANLDPHFGGAYFEGNETFWQMLMIVIVALLMLYFILASQFESLTLPLIVLIEIPIDVAMTLLALWICGISLNLMSMIGIVVMSGIVINDSILKIDTIIRLQQQGFPFAGSHSRRWGEAVEADSDDEFDYYFCFDPFFMGRRYRFPITAAAGGSYDQQDDDRYTGQSVLGTFVLLLFG